MAKVSDILYLFDRPTEPIMVPKGKEKVGFEIPDNYLVNIILFFIQHYFVVL